MRLVTVPLDQARGGILVHNVSDLGGHKVLSKGHTLTDADISKLQGLAKKEVYVAKLEPGDVPENEAAARIAAAAAGDNLDLTKAQSGRVNLLSTVRGVLSLNVIALVRLNSIPGVTVATLAAHQVVDRKKAVATVKTIGLALPERSIRQVEAVAHEQGPAMSVSPIPSARVALILAGSVQARERVVESFTAPIQARVEELGGQVIVQEYTAESPEAIAACIHRALSIGATAVILAGETSIMSEDDVTPRGIIQAGGTIESFGAPVEPGNLMLLAYYDNVPIVGAPGCIRSRDRNVVDLVLPRLLAGEHISRADISALANGGLLI